MEEESRLLESCTALGHEVKDADCNKGNTKETLGEKCVSHWNTQTLEEAAQRGHPALVILKTEQIPSNLIKAIPALSEGWDLMTSKGLFQPNSNHIQWFVRERHTKLKDKCLFAKYKVHTLKLI